MPKEGEIRQRRRDGEENGDRKLVSEKKHDVKNDKSWPSGIKSQSRGCQKGERRAALQFCFSLTTQRTCIWAQIMLINYAS